MVNPELYSISTNDLTGTGNSDVGLTSSGTNIIAGVNGNIAIVGFNSFTTNPDILSMTDEGGNTDVLVLDGVIYGGCSGLVAGYSITDANDEMTEVISVDLNSTGIVRLATDGTMVYAGAAGNVYAIIPPNTTSDDSDTDSSDDTELKWTVTIEEAAGRNVKLHAMNGQIFAATSGSVYAFDDDGNYQSIETALPSNNEINMTDDGTYLYCAADGIVYAIDPSSDTESQDSGSIVWSVNCSEIGEALTNIYYNGPQNILIAAGSGWIYQIGTSGSSAGVILWPYSIKGNLPANSNISMNFESVETRIAMDPTNPYTVYVGIAGYGFRVLITRSSLTSA